MDAPSTHACRRGTSVPLCSGTRLRTLAGVVVAAAIPRLACEPEGLPLAGELPQPEPRQSRSREKARGCGPSLLTLERSRGEAVTPERTRASCARSLRRL